MFTSLKERLAFVNEQKVIADEEAMEDSHDKVIEPKLVIYLVLCKTPQRSGKRDSGRMPYRTTSTVYKKMLEEKDNTKKEKEKG